MRRLFTNSLQSFSRFSVERAPVFSSRSFAKTTKEKGTSANASKKEGREKRNPLLGISFDQGAIHERRARNKAALTDDDTTKTAGVDFDGDWNLRTETGVVTDPALEELNQAFKLVGGKRKRNGTGIIPIAKVVEQDKDEYDRANAKGIRKSAVAQVYVKRGSGEHYVNGIPYVDYFPNITQRAVFVDPFIAIDKLGEFDVWASVKGGGFTGQSGAIRLGIARALQKFDPYFRGGLRKEGFLTVDNRKVERKKPGRKKARKLKQWVKR
jgi:small subunit ribosomal protein S9